MLAIRTLLVIMLTMNTLSMNMIVVMVMVHRNHYLRQFNDNDDDKGRVYNAIMLIFYIVKLYS